MALYKRRERFNKLSIKIGIVFSKFGLSPNAWTILSLVPVLIAFYFLAKEQFLWSALFFIISAFIDLVDGSVARVTGKVTKFGAYLDTIVDRYVEGIIIVGLLFAALPGFIYPAYVWIFLYFFGSLMTTYAKAAAKEKEIIDKELRGGLLERAERLIILFVGIIFAYFDPFYLTAIIFVLAILTNISAIERIVLAKRKSKKN